MNSLINILLKYLLNGVNSDCSDSYDKKDADMGKIEFFVADRGRKVSKNITTEIKEALFSEVNRIQFKDIL